MSVWADLRQQVCAINHRLAALAALRSLRLGAFCHCEKQQRCDVMVVLGAPGTAYRDRAGQQDRLANQALEQRWCEQWRGRCGGWAGAGAAPRREPDGRQARGRDQGGAGPVVRPALRATHACATLAPLVRCVSERLVRAGRQSTTRCSRYERRGVCCHIPPPPPLCLSGALNHALICLETPCGVVAWWWWWYRAPLPRP
jgi:hypothetical protein